MNLLRKLCHIPRSDYHLSAPTNKTQISKINQVQTTTKGGSCESVALRENRSYCYLPSELFLAIFNRFEVQTISIYKLCCHVAVEFEKAKSAIGGIHSLAAFKICILRAAGFTPSFNIVFRMICCRREPCLLVFLEPIRCARSISLTCLLSSLHSFAYYH